MSMKKAIYACPILHYMLVPLKRCSIYEDFLPFILCFFS
ncbi:hypothetical protein bcere0022_18760 [Bacillus cereus Rock3-44]|nr:hypothetical protein bcere0022_18760 [Bacillus cereus Rock3-44]